MFHNCRFLFFLLNADDWNRCKNFVILFQYSQKFSYSSSWLSTSSLVVHQIALVNFRLEILITRHNSIQDFGRIGISIHHIFRISYRYEMSIEFWLYSAATGRSNVVELIFVFKHWNSSVFGHTLIPVDSMFPNSSVILVAGWWYTENETWQIDQYRWRSVFCKCNIQQYAGANIQNHSSKTCGQLAIWRQSMRQVEANHSFRIRRSMLTNLISCASMNLEFQS